ncbi:MAG TPA: hypothetical protein VGU19_10495 [Microvirga sp.]|jgi:Ca2+-binding RTX toxin-like protein|nr:hypothetical protein [Microvirga sp.]
MTTYRITTKKKALKGTKFDDSFFGSKFKDSFDGRDGDDSIFGADGNDSLTGGVGNDEIQSGTGSDKSFGGLGNDELLGGLGNDRLYGGEGKDYLSGDEGNDSLYGDAGRDNLWGGEGDDKLYGGSNVTLVGGAGDDQFILTDYVQSTIADFSGKDYFLVRTSTFEYYDPVSDKDVIPTFDTVNPLVVGTDPKATSTLGQFLYDTDDGKLYCDIDGTGTKFNLSLVATLTNKAAVDPSDFILVL